jgi:hypothetical protein
LPTDAYCSSVPISGPPTVFCLGHVACFRPWQQKNLKKMKARRLTRNEHHRKLRAPARDISDWLVNADVSDFCRPPAVSWRCTRPPEDSSTFRTSTITCCLPRLPAASHDYLLPPMTTCCLPRLRRCDRARRGQSFLGRVSKERGAPRNNLLVVCSWERPERVLSPFHLKSSPIEGSWGSARSDPRRVPIQAPAPFQENVPRRLFPERLSRG